MPDCQLACLASEQTFSRPQGNIRFDQICVDAHPNILPLQRTGTQLVTNIRRETQMRNRARDKTPFP
jgi:hypothetical protein